MLIRHISIPRHSHLVALQEPQQNVEHHQPMDQLTHFKRTLNPEQPACDVLVGHFSPKKKQDKQEPQKALFQSFSKPQFLMNQYPQNIEDFTNSPLSSQQTQYPKQKPQNKSRNLYRIKEPWSTLTPHLSNNAYIKSTRNKDSDYMRPFEPVKNKCYLTKEPNQLLIPRQDDDDDNDDALSNHHSNVLVKNAEVYKTLERFRDRKEKEEPSVYQKKYNLSLPKSRIQNREWNSLKPSHEDSQLEMRKTRKGSDFKILERQSPRSQIPIQLKRRFIPAQEEDEQRNMIFDQKSPIKAERKASEQQSAINARPQEETIHTNKHIKKRHSAFQIRTNTPIQAIEISYRVSLSQLRQICSKPHLQDIKITMKIPQIFSYPMFTGNQQQNQLFNKASELIKHLQIKTKTDINIKKYTNCILVVSGNLGIVWHYSGKVYFGGWQHQMLDEGVKHGLGLEWVPNKYVYYGQFCNNKREGVGIMKNNLNQILAGIWKGSKFLRSIGGKVEHEASPLLGIN